MTMDKTLFITDYISESREILDSLDDMAFFATKEARDENNLKEILRLLHTLKGSSRMLEFTQIESVINHLENVFKAIQNNHTEIPSKIIQLLMNVSTVLHKVIDDIENGSDGTFEEYDEIISNINKALEGDDFSTDFLHKGNYAQEIPENQKIDEENSEFFHDSQTIKVQISQIDSILQSFDKLIMRQIKLKNEIDSLKAQNISGEFQAYQELTENIAVLENQSVEIQKSIISLRMLPFDMILRPMKRSIVSEALKTGKNIAEHNLRSRLYVWNSPSFVFHLQWVVGPLWVRLFLGRCRPSPRNRFIRRVFLLEGFLGSFPSHLFAP